MDNLMEAATKLGCEHGKERGAWVINGTTAVDTAKRIMSGYENSDPEIMDLCPKPLSSEWADDPTPCTAIEEIANLAEACHMLNTKDINEAMDIAENVLDVYEAAFNQAFWDSVILAANSILEGAK